MAYKEVDPADISYIKSIVSPERVLTGEEISEDYSHDELGGFPLCRIFWLRCRAQRRQRES